MLSACVILLAVQYSRDRQWESVAGWTEVVGLVCFDIGLAKDRQNSWGHQLRGMRRLLAALALGGFGQSLGAVTIDPVSAGNSDVLPSIVVSKKQARSTAELDKTVAHAQKRTEQPGSETANDDERGKAAKSVGYSALFRHFQIDEHSIGYLAVDAATGTVLAARQPDGGFIPASAIKVPTAIMALNVLGANHRLSTRLYMTGQVSGNTLNGDLILVGGGDPELFTDDFVPMINALKARAILKVNGRFIFDNSLFPDASAVSDAHEKNVSYNAGVGALSLNFNRLRLRWVRSDRGMRVTVYSKANRLTVPIDIVTGGVAPLGVRVPRGVVWDTNKATPRWLISPRVRRSGERWVPVKRASFHAAHVFRQFAKMSGIELPGIMPGRRPAGATLLISHRSDAMVQVARRFLKYSNNVATEIIGQGTTRRATGRPLTIRQSGAAMAEWFRQKLQKVNWAGIRIANHSGLSRDTSISPRQMVAILRWARLQTYAGYSLWDILKPYRIGSDMAYAVHTRQHQGGRGALRDLVGSDMPEWMQVRGKTGAINHVRSLAGFMVTRSTREIIFAVFIDDDRARSAAVKAGRYFEQLGPKRWSRRSRGILHGILHKWLLEF